MTTSPIGLGPSCTAAALQRKSQLDRDFARDPNDPGKFERYQAEALVYRSMPVGALTGIVCRGPGEETTILRLVQNAGHPGPLNSWPAA